MKIIIAPDSFKESMSAKQAAQAIERGFRRVYPDADYFCFPIADGGEGTVDALISANNGQRVEIQVTGPLNKPVDAHYGILHKGTLAVIEMAAASGLMLVPAAQRNPLVTTSFGTGELIKHALSLGVQQIILCVGGSATVDGGMGMMQALGIKFYDAEHNQLGLGGQYLQLIDYIDDSQLDPRLKKIQIQLACDVNNPLVGPQGAANIFGPQKGASPAMVDQLEQGMNNFADVIEKITGVDYRAYPGGGAAGGLAMAAIAFMNALVTSGIELVMQASGLATALANADLVIVGEGSMDGQSVAGKAPIGVALEAKKYAIPVIALSGMLGDDIEGLSQHGIDVALSILPRLSSLPNALIAGEINLEYAAQQVAQLLRLGSMLGGATKVLMD